MKKPIITITLLLSLTLAGAQTTNTFPANGNVGIGTTSPGTALQVHGNQLTNRISQSGGTYTEFVQRTFGGGAGILFSAYAPSTYVSGSLPVTGNTKYKYDASAFGSTSHSAKMIYVGHDIMGFYISQPSTGEGTDVLWGTPIMWLRGDGNVGIGTSSPQAKLAVNGNILAKEVKVKTNIAVPDYVFEEGYKLPDLKELEAYIKQHKHLPEVPTADEIGRDGLELAAMDLLLLKKVEELTLYLLEKDRQVQHLESSVRHMALQLKELLAKDGKETGNGGK